MHGDAGARRRAQLRLELLCPLAITPHQNVRFKSRPPGRPAVFLSGVGMSVVPGGVGRGIATWHWRSRGAARAHRRERLSPAHSPAPRPATPHTTHSRADALQFHWRRILPVVGRARVNAL